MGALLTLTFVVEVMLAFDEFEEKMFTSFSSACGGHLHRARKLRSEA
jgi:hypothetical protein